MNSTRLQQRSGQILIIALGILLFLAIALPSLITFIQNESKWTVKEQRTTKAYQLAESAAEHGYQNLLISTGVYYTVLTPATVPGFNFDTTYSGVSGGQYQIKYAAGPGAAQITIYGVGKNTAADGTLEIRALKVVYTNGGAADNAITAGNTVTIGASVNVEWGAVISYTSIDPGGRAHPRFYSAGQITGFDTNPAAPNTDNIQWWSYDTNLPSAPQIDLQYYKNLALGQGAAPAGCPSYYSNPGSGVNTNVTGCIDNQAGGRTYYFETGDWTWKNPGTNFVSGNIILANGNMNISGNGGTGAGPGIYNATIPPQAWKEYGNDWATYQCFDGAAPSSYAAAVAANYSSVATTIIPSNCASSGGSVLVHGLVYAGGGTGLNGGGNARFHGVVMTPNTVTVNSSNYTIYFDNAVAAQIHTKTLSLARSSWQELANCTWSGANASCP